MQNDSSDELKKTVGRRAIGKSDRVMDIFIHIPKTSGSTLRSVISRQYGLEHTLYCEPTSIHWPQNLSVSEFLEQSMSQREILLITGHQRYGLHEILKTHCRYFSLVRDPLQRSLSEYFYAYSYPEHRLRRQIVSGEMDFTRFIKYQMSEESNSQSFMIAGGYLATDLQSTAIANIIGGLQAVGVCERFNESLLCIAKKFAWRPPLYVRKNVTRLSDALQAERQRLSETLRDEHIAELSGDWAVYEQARVTLDGWIEQEGERFRDAYEAFGEIQRDLSLHEDAEIFEEYTLDREDSLPSAFSRVVNSEPYRLVENYLRDQTEKPPLRHNYVGYVDSFADGHISGWAIDLAQERPIYVSLWQDGQILKKIWCSRIREDVAAAGYPHARVGFRASVEHLSSTANLVVSFESSVILLKGGPEGTSFRTREPIGPA